MRRAFYSLVARSWTQIDFFSLKVLEGFNKLIRSVGVSRRFERIFLILSIDTERDLYIHGTGRAGWEIGVPYILDVFSECSVKGKACWLIEYNVRDGLFFCKPSEQLAKSDENIVREIRQKGYEFGLHPTMYSYDQGRWDTKRSLRDPTFVSDVVHQGTKAIVSVCKKHPVGCRTGHFQFALSLAKALEKEGYLVDSSILKKPWDAIVAPNAWFAGEDYRQERTSGSRTKVLEITTTDHVTAARQGLFSLDYKLHLKKSNSSILFLSAFFHNWSAIARGKINPRFSEAFENFVKALEDNNVKVVGFSEAYQLYKTSVKSTSDDD